MLSLIAAVARNRAIGLDNRLLWHLPEDMRYFRETTRGKTVIMGRKTWESLPAAFRPLPGRHNIVISRNAAYRAEGATLAGSLDEALRAANHETEIFVIGGADIYRQALHLADRLYLTEIQADCLADAFFPEFSAGEWRESSRTKGNDAKLSEDKHHQAEPAFDFVVYERKFRSPTPDN